MSSTSIHIIPAMNAAGNAVNARVAAFNHAYDKARIVSFESRWYNGMGHFDRAVHGVDAPVLANGEVIACVTPSPNDRKIIIVGTPLGNVIVHQRYTDREDIFAWNATMNLRRTRIPMIPALPSAEDIEFLLGTDDTPNIGARLGSSLSTVSPTAYDFVVRQTVELYKAQLAKYGPRE